MLYANTIDQALFTVLKKISVLPELKDFCLAGGTSLAFRIGHRKSDDLYFFTDKSFSIQEVKRAITNYSSKIELIAERPNGLSFLFRLKAPRSTLEIRYLQLGS